MADEAPAVDDEDPLVGRILGDGYVLRRRLGGGGFGAVYEAVHGDSGQVVAAKVLRVDRAALSADARTRFRREAQALISLRHPRIVAIHAHGTSEEGLEYLVMDLLEGEDLSQHLHRRRRVPLKEALDLFDGMAEAVQFAHDQGFAHRDLKPANVFLRHDAQGGYEPVVLDFGLAKMVEGSEESLTATGMVLGTPQYMAPEQATGEKVDRRADVYALGCILFEMVTGVPPFEGNTPTAILMKVLTTPPPPISPDLGVPDAIEAAIRKALAKSPDDRFDDVATFRETLSTGLKSVPMTRLMPAAGTEPPPATREARAISSGLERPSRPRRWAIPVAVAALGALVATGIGLFYAFRSPGGVEVAATAPTPIAMAPIDEHDETLAEEPGEPSEVASADAGPNEQGAPPTEFPDAPPEESPTMRSQPSQMRGRRVTTTAAETMAASMRTGPSPAAAATPGGHDYAADVRRLEANLNEVERTVSAVAATRRGLRDLGNGSKPGFCGRGGGLPSGSEDGVVVSTVQQLRRIREAACEPFERSREPDSATLQKLRRIPATLDRAEQMANDRTISSNTPADVADQVAAAVAEARRLLQGVDDGSRPFPCDAPVFARLRRLEQSPNSWSGAAAGRVTRMQRDICRAVGGVSGGEARALAERLTGQLDTAEGSINAHQRSVQRSLTATRAMLR